MGHKLEKLPPIDELVRIRRKRKMIGCSVALIVFVYLVLYLCALSTGNFSPTPREMLEAGNLWYMQLSGQINTGARIEQGWESAVKVAYFDVGMIGDQPAIAAVLEVWDGTDDQNYPLFIQSSSRKETLTDWKTTFLSKQQGTWISSISVVKDSPKPAVTYFSITNYRNPGSHSGQSRAMVFARCPYESPGGWVSWHHSDLGLDQSWGYQNKIEAISVNDIPYLASIFNYLHSSSVPSGVTVFQANGQHPFSKTDWEKTSSMYAETGIWRDELLGLAAVNGKPVVAAITGDGIMYAQSLQDETSKIVGWETTTVSNERGFWKLRLAEYKGKPVLAWLGDQVKDPDEFFGIKTKYNTLRMAVAKVAEPTGPDDWNLFELESGIDIDNFSIAEVNGELAVAYSYETSATIKYRKWGFLTMDYEECEYEMRYAHTSHPSPSTGAGWVFEAVQQRGVEPFNPKLLEYQGEALIVFLGDDKTTFRLARPNDDDDNVDGGWAISDAVNLAEEDF